MSLINLKPVYLINNNDETNTPAKLSYGGKFIPANIVKQQAYKFPNIYTKNNNLYVSIIPTLDNKILYELQKEEEFRILENYNYYLPEQRDILYKILRHYNKDGHYIYRINNTLYIHYDNEEFDFSYLPGFESICLINTKNKIDLPDKFIDITLKDSQDIELITNNKNTKSIFFKSGSINSIKNESYSNYDFKDNYLNNNLDLFVSNTIKLDTVKLKDYNINILNDSDKKFDKLELINTDLSKIHFKNPDCKYNDLYIQYYISSNPVNIENVLSDFRINKCHENQENIHINKLYKSINCEIRFENIGEQIIIDELILDYNSTDTVFNIGRFNNCDQVLIKKIVVNVDKDFTLYFDGSSSNSNIIIEKINLKPEVKLFKIKPDKDITVTYKDKILTRLSTFKRKIDGSTQI